MWPFEFRKTAGAKGWPSNELGLQSCFCIFPVFLLLQISIVARHLLASCNEQPSLNTRHRCSTECRNTSTLGKLIPCIHSCAQLSLFHDTSSCTFCHVLLWACESLHISVVILLTRPLIWLSFTSLLHIFLLNNSSVCSSYHLSVEAFLDLTSLSHKGLHVSLR